MSAALIRDLYEYHQWANRRLFDVAAGPDMGINTYRTEVVKG
jgi:uncharacterized damage-inducible protein DinB